MKLKNEKWKQLWGFPFPGVMAQGLQVKAMSVSQRNNSIYSVGSFSGVSNVCDIVMYVINFNLLVSNIFL